MDNSEAFVVAWNPVPSAGRVAASSRAMRWTLIQGLIIPVVLFIIWLAGGRSSQILIDLVVLGLVFTALAVTVRGLRLARARRALAKVPRGVALRVDRSGLYVSASGQDNGALDHVAWERVVAVRAESKAGGSGPDLVVESDSGQWRASLSFLDALPGTIDSALRAYSGGRWGLDLSGLDTIW